MIKYPVCVLRPARLVTQMTDLVVRALPQPVYPAMIPISVPKMLVDMPER
jgi:hypothetical protein